MQALPSDKRVSIYGSKNDVAKALEALLKYEDATPEQLTEEWKKRDSRLEDVEGFINFLNMSRLSSLSESKARLLIQEIMDTERLKADILLNGNNVWSFNRIVNNLKQIVEAGALVGENVRTCYPLASGLRIPTIRDYQPILSKYFYQFLSLCCGSIAHYDIYGWISHYPTVEDLRQFFIKNEYSKRVKDWIPEWKTDAKRIVEEIEVILNVNRNSAC